MNNQSLVSRISALFTASIISLGLIILTSCGGGGTSTYTVGGSVIGISGTGLVLQLNGANDLSVNGNGDYTFTTSLTSGSSYSVTTLSSPAGQTCRVSNGSGTLSANVVNVSVECRTNQDPNGYYINTGSATVGDGGSSTLSITDLQAIIYDNRFMATSVSNGLLYDGPLEMFGDELTATVSVYRDGLLIYSNVNVTGIVMSGSSISGSFIGTQEGLGTFQLDHSMDTSTASILRVENNLSSWASPIGGSTSSATFVVDSYGFITGYDGPVSSDGNMALCTIYSVAGNNPVAVLPISGTSLYRITIQLSDCENTNIQTILGSAGYYTGFATSRTDSSADDTLVFIVTSTNGQYAVEGDFILNF